MRGRGAGFCGVDAAAGDRGAAAGRAGEGRGLAGEPDCRARGSGGGGRESCTGGSGGGVFDVGDTEEDSGNGSEVLSETEEDISEQEAARKKCKSRRVEECEGARVRDTCAAERLPRSLHSATA